MTASTKAYIEKSMATKKDTFSTEEIAFFTKVDAFSAKFRSGAKAAEALGLSEGTFNSYKYRLRHPKLANVGRLVAIMDDYLESSPGVAITDVQRDKTPHVITESSCVRVPVMAEVGAGVPLEVWEQEPIEYISIMPEYMKADLRVFRVSGDSMAPTIKRGAYVGVTPLQDVMLKEGQIYLCYNPPFGCVVKRVRPAANNSILLLSDNPEYEPVQVSLDEYQRVVLGEVRWVMQSV